MLNFGGTVNPKGSYDPCFMSNLNTGEWSHSWNTCILGKPMQQGADVLNNCVGWVQGRALQIYRQITDCFPEDDHYHIFSIFNCDPVNFIPRAKEHGFTVTDHPEAGSIFVTDNHVGIVEWKKENGNWLISESGYDYNGEAVLFQESIYQSGGVWYSTFSSPSKKINGFILIPKVESGFQWEKVWVLKQDGKLVYGWKKLLGKWYYMDQYGIMVTGWKLINGKWYYFNPENGDMVTGWKLVSGKWYYMDKHGAMKTGWLFDNGYWYYLGSDGAMLTGWQKINGVWYYFKPNGKMVTGDYTIGGKSYHFDETGRWVGNA